MTEEELFELMKEINPEATGVSIGIMRLVVKLEDRIRAEFAASMEAELAESKRLLALCMSCRANIVTANVNYGVA